MEFWEINKYNTIHRYTLIFSNILFSRFFNEEYENQGTRLYLT